MGTKTTHKYTRSVSLTIEQLAIIQNVADEKGINFSQAARYIIDAFAGKQGS